ncbi:PBSX family phage terminase large subunit [Phaeovibrio sulfidiphilus]|uniref:PBSX family phage terminase large subunit n=1 Tax=Phaeovibrio sulfidiphilus TaxID=1220600 RepID=A0A8J6YW16_9PROT|nr:PBSX family phage terminase large subunit [Phaeovibrio sulfidiphilus]MBE1237484.1 PBSX family phage terminase large subunit [Phaeovibrio sulfidiphilus]
MEKHVPPDTDRIRDAVASGARLEAASSAPVQDPPVPPAFRPLFRPARYKVFYGGRGAAKSWAFARALVALSARTPCRVLCARELQVSIRESVHRLLCDQIDELGYGELFERKKSEIRSRAGGEFIFKGLRHNASEIKSLEGVDICWVEEAQSVSKNSWDLLVPTIRKEGSEIWVSFNPENPDDDTYRRFVRHPPENAIVVKVTWRDNPWFPETLRAEMETCRRTDPDAFAHIWEGEPKRISDAQVFRDRYVVEAFETPPVARFLHGADWGFARDPTVLVRAFTHEKRLYVDREAWGIGVELDRLPDLFDTIDTARHWPIRADSARPETIAHMKRRGFNISPAKKWPGSVEDGLAVLRGFETVVVHPRCVHTADEMRLYSYKVDRVSGAVLPVLADQNDHCIDALRYALDETIRNRTAIRINPALVSGPRPAARSDGRR